MNIFIMNRYISKSYTRSKNSIYRVGAAVVSTITSTEYIWTEKGTTTRKARGTRLSAVAQLFDRAGKNGGKFYTFCELLPKAYQEQQKYNSTH